MLLLSLKSLSYVFFLLVPFTSSFHFEYERKFSEPADFVSFSGRGAITYAITNNDVKTVYLYTTYYRKDRNESALARLSSVRGSEKGFGRSTKLVNHPYYPDSGDKQSLYIIYCIVFVYVYISQSLSLSLHESLCQCVSCFCSP